jgi:hypothetical protein
LVVVVAVEKFVAKIEIGIPLASESVARSDPVAETAVELAGRVCYYSEEALPVCPKECGWCWLVSGVVFRSGAGVFEFAPFDTGNEGIACGGGDIGNCDDV